VTKEISISHEADAIGVACGEFTFLSFVKRILQVQKVMHFLAGDFSGQDILDQCFVVTDLVNVHGNVFLSANVRFSSTVVGNIDCLILATEWRINAEHPACQSALRGIRVYIPCMMSRRRLQTKAKVFVFVERKRNESTHPTARAQR
jgi:hypothetical protein